MITFNQLSNNLFIRRRIKKRRRLSLKRSPQKKGQCIRVYTTSPKKPSSGRRKVARVFLTNKKKITCHIPGLGGHNLQKFSTVLIRGCRVRDIPSIKYRAIRGKYDLKFVYDRLTSRSKYGKPKLDK